MSKLMLLPVGALLVLQQIGIWRRLTTLITEYKLQLMNDLGFEEFDSELDRRAEILVRNDANFLSSLVRLRKERGMTQEVVAERMNVSQPAVAAFERAENDPKLSTIRRYAMAVGLLVEHIVETDEGSTFHFTVPLGESDDLFGDETPSLSHYSLEFSYAS